MSPLRLSLLFTLTTLCGCAAQPQAQAPNPDAGHSDLGSVDLGFTDGARLDSPMTDAPLTDTSIVDAFVADAGDMGATDMAVPVTDSGVDLGTDMGIPVTDMGTVLPPHLATKNIYGAPSGPFVISFSGVANTDLQLRFRNRANMVVSTSSVSPTGAITLPPFAGVYTTELRDTRNGNISYGQATITIGVSMFTTIQSGIPSPAFGPYRYWPEASLEVGDYNNDTYQDIVLMSGTNGTGAIASPGLYLFGWNPATSALELDQVVGTSDTIARGVRFADFDADGDMDLVYGVYDVTTFTRKICRSLNSGGIFAASMCVSDASGSMSAQSIIFDIAIGDLDRDGYPDVISAGGNSNGSTWNTARTSIWHNVAGTTLGAPSNLDIATTLPFASVVVGDLQDDGLLDVVAVGPPAAVGSVHMFPQSAAGTFSTGTEFVYNGSGANEVSIGYLNSDNKLDLIVMQGGTSNASVLFSQASGAVWAESSMPASTEQYGGRANIADLDQVGTPMVVVSPKNRLIYNDHSGLYFRLVDELTTSFSVNATNAISGGTTLSGWAEANALFADFDHDGRIDCFYYAISGTPFFEVMRGT